VFAACLGKYLLRQIDGQFRVERRIESHEYLLISLVDIVVEEIFAIGANVGRLESRCVGQARAADRARNQGPVPTVEVTTSANPGVTLRRRAVSVTPTTSSLAEFAAERLLYQVDLADAF
jgi:hypothetical protein